MSLRPRQKSGEAIYDGKRLLRRSSSAELLAMTITKKIIMNWNGTVSLLIACLEFLLLFNLLVFADKNKLNKIAIIMIALLAGYQTMEFLMCQVELQSSFFPYFAFIIISFLPPLNLLIVFAFKPKSELKLLKKIIFLPAIFFSIYYTLLSLNLQ